MSMVNLTSTPTDPVTAARTLTVDPINFDADFRILKEGPGEVILTNIKANADAPETLRIAWSEVKDVFAQSGIEQGVNPSGTSVSKRGVSLLIQLTGVGTDENDQKFPWSVHQVFKIPVGLNVAGTDIAAALGRLIGTMYDTGASTNATRIGALIRGAIAPKEL